jgi:hypothetical protein
MAYLADHHIGEVTLNACGEQATNAITHSQAATMVVLLLLLHTILTHLLLHPVAMPAPGVQRSCTIPTRTSTTWTTAVAFSLNPKP